MTTPRIVAIGEVLWDVYPPPRPARLGGAPANLACHAAGLGAESWLVSAVGRDPPGDRALAGLRARGVHVDHVARDGDHPTGRVDVRLDDAGRPTFRIASAAAWDHIPWSDALRALAADAHAICFGTLAQREPESRATITRLLTCAGPSMRLLDVNLRQHYHSPERILDALTLASALKLNEEELPVVAAACQLAVSDAITTLRAIAEHNALDLVALTRGPDGAILVTAAEESVVPAPRIEVVDTVGAGDAFTATLVYDVLRGLPLDDVNRHANEEAARICATPRTSRS